MIIYDREQLQKTVTTTWTPVWFADDSAQVGEELVLNMGVEVALALSRFLMAPTSQRPDLGTSDHMWEAADAARRKI